MDTTKTSQGKEANTHTMKPDTKAQRAAAAFTDPHTVPADPGREGGSDGR